MAEPAEDGHDGAGRRAKSWLIVAAVVALAIVAAVAFLLTRDDDDDEPATTAPGTTEVSGAIPAPTREPGGLGDDAGFDELAEQCYDGSMASCDDLYRQSPSGSAYETYGDTCAGRQREDTGQFCVSAFPG